MGSFHDKQNRVTLLEESQSCSCRAMWFFLPPFSLCSTLFSIFLSFFSLSFPCFYDHAFFFCLCDHFQWQIFPDLFTSGDSELAHCLCLAPGGKINLYKQPSFSSLVFSPRVLYTITAETSIVPKSWLYSHGFHSHPWVSLPSMNDQCSNEGRKNKLWKDSLLYQNKSQSGLCC